MAKSNQWELFGFDLRQLGQFFKRAWLDVFWAYNSVVRKKLDVPVKFCRLQGDAAPDLPASSAGPCAVVLPDEAVLKRTLVLPRSALTHLDQIVAAEVEASSPFKSMEIAVGTCVSHLPDKKISVKLAIVSRSGVMQWLHNQAPEASAQNYEVWAEYDGDMVVLQGFGESLRDRLYKKRLSVFAANMAMGLVALLVLLALPLMYQSYRLAKVEQLLADSRQQARVAMGYRNSLAGNNAHLAVLQQQIGAGAQPLEPLRVLSQQMDTSAWLGSYQQTNNVVEVDGYAANAAALIQQLTASEAFDEVKSVSAIRKLGREQIERFRLELHLAARGEEENE